MRSRRLLLLVVALGALAAAVLLVLPRAVDAAARRLVATAVAAEPSWRSWSARGLSGLSIEAPELTLGDRRVLVARSLDLDFSFAAFPPRLVALRARGVKFDLDRTAAGEIFRVPERDTGVAFEIAVVIEEASGRFENIELSRVAGAALVSGGAGPLEVSIESFSGVGPLGPFVANGFLRRGEEGPWRVEGQVALGGLRVAVKRDGAWSLSARDADTRILNEALSRYLAPRFPDSAAAWLAAHPLERLDSVTLTVAGETRREARIAGLAVAGLPVEILEATLAVLPSRIEIDSFAARWRLDRGEGRLEADRASWEDGRLLVRHLLAGDSAFRLAGRDVSIVDGRIDARIDRFEGVVAGARVAADGRVDGPWNDPSFEGALDVEGLRLGPVGTGFSATGRIERFLTSASAELLQRHGRLSWRDHLVAASPSRIRFLPGRLEFVDPLRLEGESLAARITGALLLGPSLAAAIEHLSVNVAARAGNASILGHPEIAFESAAVSGEPGRGWTVAVRGLEAPEFRAASVVAFDSGYVGTPRRGGSAAVTIEGGEAPGLIVRIARAVISSETGEASLLFEGLVGPGLVPIRAEAAGGTGGIEAAGRRFRGPLSFRWSRGGIEMAARQGDGSGSEAEWTGRYEKGVLRASGRLAVDLSDLVEAARPRLPWLESGEGRLEGTFEIGETTAAALHLTGGRLVLNSGIAVEDLEGRVTCATGDRDAGRTWRIAALSGRTQGGTFSVAGTVEEGMEGEEPLLALRFEGANADLAAFERLHPVLENVSGRADARLMVEGPVSRFAVEGAVDLRDVSIPIGGTARAEELSGRIEFTREGARLAGLAGRIGGGRVSAEGTYGFGASSATRLEGRLENASIRPAAGIEGRLSGEFSLLPGSERPVFRARFLAAPCRFLLPEFLSAEPPPLSGRPPLLDLDVILAVRDLRVSGNDLEMRLSSDTLHLTGNDVAPRIEGVLEGTSGRLVTRHATFRVREARVVLPDQGEVALEARALARVGRIQVLAHVSGPISDQRVALSSEPQRSEEELVRLLAFGREEGFSGEEFSTGGEARNFAVPLIASSIGGDLGSEAGLESLRLEKSSTDTGSATFTRVSLGAYISDRIYLGYSQPTSVGEERRVEMELEVNPDLYLRFEAGDRGTAGAGFEWRKDY